MTVMADGMIEVIEIKVVDGIKIRMVGETEELVLVRDPDQENGNEASAVGETEGTINILSIIKIVFCPCKTPFISAMLFD